MSTNLNVVEEEKSLIEILAEYLKYWYLFIILPILCLGGAVIYLRYSTDIYVSEATILVKSDKASAISEADIIKDIARLGFKNFGKSDFENEIEILKSKRLNTLVIEKLGFNVKYYKVGRVKLGEIHKYQPFELQFIEGYNKQARFSVFVKVKSDTNFEYKRSEDAPYIPMQYGNPISFDEYSFTLLPTSGQDFVPDEEYLVQVIPVDQAVNQMRGNMGIERATKLTEVIRISITSSVRERAEDYINMLIQVYNEDAINDRNLVVKNTANFIDKRLEIVTKELDSVELNKVNFKEDNGLTDIQIEGQLFLENVSSYTQRVAETETQIQLVESLRDYMLEDEEYGLLPANIGINTEGLGSIVSSYNELILRRQELLKTSTERNPVVQNLDNAITDIKGNIVESLNTSLAGLQIARNDLNKQGGQIQGNISKIPELERKARDIERQRTIKETLYLLLLQRREETAISLAITTPKAKIVDAAFSNNSPIFPKKGMIYFAAFALGLLLSLGVAYLLALLDNKIHNRKDIERELGDVAILGEIPQIKKGQSEIINFNDRSILAESFRILRTNLGYFIRGRDKKKKNVIYVTSTIKGEGKTFVAFNLLLTLASAGKKVLLVGADIRNPQLHRYLSLGKDNSGTAEYLFNYDLKAKDIIFSEAVNNHSFDIILSGLTPPNPTELFLSERFGELIDEVVDLYDYIIVDTAPTMQVADTLLISKYADITVFVGRSDFTQKRILHYSNDLVRDKKLQTVAYVVNGVKSANFGYGTKYGYGYGNEQIGFWERFKALFSRAT